MKKSEFIEAWLEHISDFNRLKRNRNASDELKVLIEFFQEQLIIIVKEVGENYED
jgi:hypothetical protein